MMNGPAHIAATGAAATRSAQPLLVAGIGASAGGLEAMLPLFASMRATGRMAYVVAQHMAPDGHDELLVRLMSRESALPVVLACGDENLRADTVYVIPSGRDGIVSGTTLRLREPSPDSVSTPSVNALFQSMAETLRGNAIGIVLSGTGYDGMLGCRALRAHGALIIVQAPADAKFNGMPNAVIEARLADEILPVSAIGMALAERFPGVALPPPRPASPLSTVPPSAVRSGAKAVAPANPELAQLLPLMQQATGIDFSSYKEETLLRRLEGRKRALGIADAAAYLALVRREPEELKTLQRLFLVIVSSFFRDRESFRALEHALEGVVAGKADGEPVRVWVPGCASGEEVYTLAVMIDGLLGKRRDRHPVRIVGTDLSAAALDAARSGVYREKAFGEMDASLRARYLRASGQQFEVAPGLRDMVEWELRNVLTGPPASMEGRLDLVSCRNLLIYMNSDLQERLIGSFHRALAPNGLLFIGQSESLTPAGNALFAAIDHYHRLYRRRT